MDVESCQAAAVFEAVVFLEHFENLPDKRQSAKTRYRLDEALLLCLLATIAGAETVADIARFGDNKLELLRRFRPFRAGTPSHDQIGNILAALDAEAFEQCFVAWVASLIDVPEGVVAIDGKTVRRSKTKGRAAAHIVSAFAAQRRLVLGQVKVGEKANEIVAIPKLLDMLAIEGAVVTIDAMGCQRDIARKIRDKKADYILALKGNQGTLREDVELFANEQKANNFSGTTISHAQTVDGDHGRVETRDVTVFHDVTWLKDHQWPGLSRVVMVESTREIGEKIERETRFYITSLALVASLIAPLVRDHWAVENSLHWVLDMVFRDDECRLRIHHAPANFSTIKHMALNLIRRAPGKDSMRMRRKVAAWNDNFLAAVISN